MDSIRNLPALNCVYPVRLRLNTDGRHSTFSSVRAIISPFLIYRIFTVRRIREIDRGHVCFHGGLDRGSHSNADSYQSRGDALSGIHVSEACNDERWTDIELDSRTDRDILCRMIEEEENTRGELGKD
jgi:hypothetical protein